MSHAKHPRYHLDFSLVSLVVEGIPPCCKTMKLKIMKQLVKKIASTRSGERNSSMKLVI